MRLGNYLTAAFVLVGNTASTTVLDHHWYASDTYSGIQIYSPSRTSIRLSDNDLLPNNVCSRSFDQLPGNMKTDGIYYTENANLRG